MVVIASSKHFKMLVYSWSEYVVQAKHVSCTADVKKSSIFYIAKYVIEEKGPSMKQISPKPLYSLVMATFPQQ